MDRIEVSSPAKVNLTLEVGARRADGYHEIDSIAQVIDLSDRLTVERVPEGVIEVVVGSGDAPAGRENLVYTACEAFLQAAGIRGGVRVKLDKRIPVQAGLGGGSGNASVAIITLDRLYETHLSGEDLCAMAASVGSDAALFVHGGTVRMRGRGDVVVPLPDAPELHLVVAKPSIGVSTAWAYAELDKGSAERAGKASDRAEAAVLAGDWESLTDSLSNDFDPVVSQAFSEIGELKALLAAVGARRALLCGSGSAVFGVFSSAADARRAEDRVRGSFPQAFVTRSLTRAESGGVTSH